MLESFKTPTHAKDAGVLRVTAYAPLSFKNATKSFGRSSTSVRDSVNSRQMHVHIKFQNSMHYNTLKPGMTKISFARCLILASCGAAPKHS